MSEHKQPSVYNIAAHGGFADALAQGLIDRFAKDVFGLAKGLIILPNNRARQALQDAFVRLSEDGLLLPQMAVIGDLDLDESIGAALDSGELTLGIKPSVDQMDRLLTVARLIEVDADTNGKPVHAKEALRLAREFIRTMDQLTAEEVSLQTLFDIDVEPELSGHWQDSLASFRRISEQWQKSLADQGRIDEAARRNALFDAISAAWKTKPPKRFVVAAGITTSAPAIARLLRMIAFLQQGMVVLPDLDLIMPEEEWSALGPFKKDELSGHTRRSQETHPQYHMKLLLERMSVARSEIIRWPRISESSAAAKRSRALSHAFAIPKLTARWQELKSEDRSLAGVKTVEARTSSEEAQAVAILAREALEEPEKRVAIITPDRDLATRISAHLERWDIKVNDTAGRPLSMEPEGVFFLGMISAVCDDFPPAEFLVLLKHPLVRGGELRGQWLTAVRQLDLLLRGPRPSPGLSGIDQLLRDDNPRLKDLRARVTPWWNETRSIFEPISALMASRTRWSDVIEHLRSLADGLTGGDIWKGAAGRALADFLTELEMRHSLGPQNIWPEQWTGYFETFLSNISVRPPYAGHPRITLYGLLEARLQQADLVICCGLNEGSWPQAITPDPWLAPMVRKSLGLPAQDRQIGLSAHDLVGAMGGRRVILTRAMRDSSGPAIASRFLLRLKAMCGDNLKELSAATMLARDIDRPAELNPASRPAPKPSAEQRRVKISVTNVDSLIADPYAFYAKKILRLGTIDMIDAEPSPAWRGSIIHDILEEWAKEDDYDPDGLIRRAEAFLSDRSSHPLTRTLWAPRLMQGLRWVAETTRKNRGDQRNPAASEIEGHASIAGVDLFGRADRFDYLSDGTLAVIDYKTGAPPSNKAVKNGFNLQLGLLGAIAEHGGFDGLSGTVRAFEYWSLAKAKDEFGYVSSPDNPRSRHRVEPDAIVDHAIAEFNKAVDKYIHGNDEMLAKLHPEYSPYTDYNQLMRLEEWYGRTELKKAVLGGEEIHE